MGYIIRVIGVIKRCNTIWLLQKYSGLQETEGEHEGLLRVRKGYEVLHFAKQNSINVCVVTVLWNTTFKRPR